MASTGNFLRTLDDAVKTKLNGARLEGTLVPVHYAFPEPEFVAAEYPCITFYRYFISRATRRKHNYKHNKGRNWYYTNDAQNEIINVRHPEPYDVFYQVDIHSKYNAHDVLLQEHLLKTLDTFGYLTYTSDYTTASQTVATSLLEVMNLDSSGEEGKRTFRKTYRYRVEGWFEFAKDDPIPPIQDIDVILHDYSDGIKRWTGTLIVSGYAHVV